MPAPCRACGKLTNEKLPNCVYCGTLLVPPVPCPTCKRDVPAHFPKCLYCGTPTSGAKPAVPAATVAAAAPLAIAPAAPAPEPALPPRPPSLKAPVPLPRRIAGYVILAIPVLAIAWALWHFRTVKAMWPCLTVIAWYLLASVSFTTRQRTISRLGFVGRDARIDTTLTGVNLRSSAIQLGLSLLLWLAIYLLAFKGSFGSSKWSFAIGLPMFAGSLMTNYKFKSTRTRVMDPDLEQHIDEFGLPLAVLRQYYIWGFMPPFVHAVFRLML